mmetsp:Transcript_40954/g.118322  ORF Transcript_40954/g.118322 Transcript_40954/m.118322 type:complete len:214 (+) Transcript_40954:224-865(+)
MPEDALDPVIAALHLALLQVVLARAGARAQVAAAAEDVAAGEVGVARHLPHGLDALIVHPGLCVLPEVKAHSCEVRHVRRQRLARLRGGHVRLRGRLAVRRALGHREGVAHDDALADPRAPPEVVARGAAPGPVLVHGEGILPKVHEAWDYRVHAELSKTKGICRVHLPLPTQLGMSLSDRGDDEQEDRQQPRRVETIRSQSIGSHLSCHAEG